MPNRFDLERPIFGNIMWQGHVFRVDAAQDMARYHYHLPPNIGPPIHTSAQTNQILHDDILGERKVFRGLARPDT